MKTLMVTLLLLSSVTSLAFDHTYKTWTSLLQNHVKMSKDQTSSKVDYKNFDKTKLQSFLKTLSALKKNQFKAFTKNQKLAFYINAYNAFTIKLILDNYPVDSIKDLGGFFSSPWKKEFFKIFGEEAYLDKIEHTWVRGSKELGTEARVHFAFNCASVGCPALLNTAWVAQSLESQFDSAARNFLKDHSRNYVDLKSKKVKLSNIFKWYGKDFSGRNYSSLKMFLKTYASALAKDAKEKALIDSGQFSISYTGYDWKLNKL